MIATGGREGRLVIHDLRTPLSSVLAWRNQPQQVLSRKGTNQNISITGLASFHDQLIATDSNTDRLSFYDLRKPELLVYACCFESEDQKRKGSTSLQIVDSTVLVNNMTNQVLAYKLADVT